METFELILLILTCTVISAVLDQVISRVSLPLIQIGIGFIAAILLPQVARVTISSELLLVLFIAPLLFEDARNANPRDLWANKGAIVSLAIGLVLAIVLVLGFALHILVPSTPLAAAFAFAAALGPTDAAAVAALRSTVSLNRRQQTLLQGEALINDASGVVSFQFAVAAFVTGFFSIWDAVGSFVQLFFGGIIAGVILGWLIKTVFRAIRRNGLESSTIHILYEVITPFAVYLAAEALDVSGILAVVAAGLVMAEPSPRLTSSSATRHRLVSNGVWELLVFLINGFLFVLLGMQLPKAMNPALMDNLFSTGELIALVLILTALLVLTRLIWTSVMELVSKNAETGQRGWHTWKKAIKQALIVTVAGPKGAVTLSIIFTLPLIVNGDIFPNRDLLIFLCAGVILCTLLLADFSLPLLAPSPDAERANAGMSLNEARTFVFRAVIQELRDKTAEKTKPEFEPATQAVIGQYRKRLINVERHDVSQDMLDRLRIDILARQESYLDELQDTHEYDSDTIDHVRRVLKRRRQLMGADVHAGGIISRAVGAVRRAGYQIWLGVRTIKHGRATKLDPDATIAMSPVQKRESGELLIKLEQIAIEFLKEQVATTSGEHKRAASILLEEHRITLASAKARAAADKDDDTLDETPDAMAAARAQRNARTRYAYASSMSRLLGINADMMTPDQIQLMSKHLAEVEAGALSMELDKIRQLHERGKISQKTARAMREDVYVLQMGISEGSSNH